MDWSVYVNHQELFDSTAKTTITGTDVRNQLKSIVTGNDTVSIIKFTNVGCTIEAMTNMITSIVSYNTEANQLEELDLTQLSLFSTGNFTDLYDETLNVTRLTYDITTEDTSQETNALFDLADQITKNSADMTSVVMTKVEFDGSQFEAIV